MLGQRVVLALREEEVLRTSSPRLSIDGEFGEALTLRLSVSVNASKHRLHTGLHTGRFLVHFRGSARTGR